MSNLNNDGLFVQVLQAQEIEREGWMEECKPTVAMSNTINDSAMNILNDKCQIPPQGWECTRNAGHEGPCASIPNEDTSYTLTHPSKYNV